MEPGRKTRHIFTFLGQASLNRAQRVRGDGVAEDLEFDRSDPPAVDEHQN
jgi:hypothetical protein